MQVATCSYHTLGMLCVSVSNAILWVWFPEKSFAVTFTFCSEHAYVIVAWCIHSYSFAIHNSLAKVTRKTYQKHGKRVCTINPSPYMSKVLFKVVGFWQWLHLLAWNSFNHANYTCWLRIWLLWLLHILCQVVATHWSSMRVYAHFFLDTSATMQWPSQLASHGKLLTLS